VVLLASYVDKRWFQPNRCWEQRPGEPVIKNIHLGRKRAMHRNHYIPLAIMTALMFVAMFILMYAMVDRFANVFANVNQVYMAGLMTAPMVLIELAIMRAMYRNRTANLAIVALSVLALAGFWVGIRQQVAVGDAQFVRSMIPHHAGAILMCGKAPVRDAELQSLCDGIIRGQQLEIDQMKRIMARLN
jgi:uncharacterized protein (DUF305 family)